jgi:hypothetical protein
MSELHDSRVKTRTYGERRGAYRVLVEKLDGKRSVGSSRRRCENNIRMALQEVGRGHGLD